MNALTTSIRRDDFGWATLAPRSTGGLRPRTECTEILPFRRVASPDRQHRTSGNRHFADAYRADRRYRTYRMDSPVFQQPVFVTVMPTFHGIARNDQPGVFPHATAILHGGHLMDRFGIWIVALVTTQLMSAWMIGAVAGQALGTGRYFHSFTWLLLMLAFNLQVWLRYYGRESKAFQVPGICLFLAAILPVFLLHFLAQT